MANKISLETIEEIAKGEVAELTRTAKQSFEKLSELLHENVFDVKINQIPRKITERDMLYHLFVAYAQGEDSLRIFAEEENIEYKEINSLLSYLKLR